MYLLEIAMKLFPLVTDILHQQIFYAFVVGGFHETTVPLEVQLAKQLLMLLLIYLIRPLFSPFLSELFFRHQSSFFFKACLKITVEDAIGRVLYFFREGFVDGQPEGFVVWVLFHL